MKNSKNAHPTLYPQTRQIIDKIFPLLAFGSEAKDIIPILQEVIKIFKESFHARSCSVFLHDHDENSLHLYASTAIKHELDSYEILSDRGLIKQALLEKKAFQTQNFSQDPNEAVLRAIDGTDELLGLFIPLSKHQTPFGLLYFSYLPHENLTNEELSVLMQVAQTLSLFLDNALYLVQLHFAAQKRSRKAKLSETKKFKAVSSNFNGIVLGNSYFIKRELLENFSHDFENSPNDSLDLQEALKQTELQIDTLQKEVSRRYSDVASLIFETHLMMLHDPSFSGRMLELIQQGWRADHAVEHVVDHYSKIFMRSSLHRIREKTQDVQDLGHRVLQNLLHENQEGDYSGQIILSSHIFPSELIKLALQNAEGIIIYGKNPSAHLSILANSVDIPVLFCGTASLFQLPEETELIIDGEHSLIIAQPDFELKQYYISLISKSEKIRKNVTMDDIKLASGETIQLKATINLLSEAVLARRMNFPSIGLYRSEIPFLIRDNSPDEEEQYAIYSQLFELMEQRPVVLRTLDAGGDKLIPQMSRREKNPFLGLRGIRYSLKNKSAFISQLRAMLRSAWNKDLYILFPMITSLDEFFEARNLVTETISKLEKEGIKHHHHPKIGAMIESPSAALNIKRFAQECDFLAIGTNDLIQYTIAVDRTNELVSEMFSPYYPAVLELLRQIQQSCEEYHCPVTLCGNFAEDLSFLPILLGLGFRSFSIPPRAANKILQLLPLLHLQNCEKLFDEVSQLSLCTDIIKRVAHFRESILSGSTL